MFTAQKADEFAKELEALRKKYITAETGTEERLVAGGVVSEILKDCTEGLDATGEQVMLTSGVDEAELTERIASIHERQEELMPNRKIAEHVALAMDRFFGAMRTPLVTLDFPLNPTAFKF